MHMRFTVLLVALLIAPSVAAAQNPTDASSTSSTAEPATFSGKTVDQWADQLLQSKDPRKKWYAAYALGQIGPKAAAAVEPLATFVRTIGPKEEEYARAGSAWALGQIGPGAADAVPALAETLGVTTLPSIRRNIPRALGRIGEPARPAVPALLAVLDDPDQTVATGAAIALWRIEKHPRAMPAILDMLKQPAGPAPFLAAKALGEMEDVPVETVAPSLTAALRHPQGDVRRAAARSLGQIGAPTLPAVRAALANSDVATRSAALSALVWFGELGIPDFSAALADTEPTIRRQAAAALGRIGAPAKDALGKLVDLTADPDPAVRAAAADAYARIQAALAEGTSP